MPKKDPQGLLPSNQNPLANVDDGLGPIRKRTSEELIRESIMRGGGEAFGAPYEISVASLTEKIVQYFRQRGFFSFEFFEKPRAKKNSNRFTLYGAARYFGRYDVQSAAKARRRLNKKKK